MRQQSRIVYAPMSFKSRVTLVRERLIALFSFSRCQFCQGRTAAEFCGRCGKPVSLRAGL